MAYRLTKAMRSILAEKGQLAAFIERRTVLANAGMSPQESLKKTLDEFFPPPPPLEPVVAAPVETPDDGLLDLTDELRQMFNEKPEPAEREVIKWLFDNLAIRKVELKDAPSIGAWGLLNTLQKNDKLREKFYTEVWTKLLPSKAQIDAENKFTDDNRTLFEVLTKLEQEPVLQSGSEGSEG
jgi:hypothetical protein